MTLEKVQLLITVIRGSDLVAKDRNLLGKKTSSDPYTEVWFSNRSRVGRTKTKKKNLNPVWNETFSYEVPMKMIPPPSLVFKIFDYDIASNPDSMGVVSIPCPTTAGIVTDWYDIPRNSARNATGRIEIKIETKFITSRSLVRGNVFDLNADDPHRVGLAWDMIKGGKPVDMDVSCVAITSTGQISMDDTVYYGNKSNRNNSIVHSGDEREGDEIGDDESIYLGLSKIPPNVLALYIILTVATEGVQLSHVKSATARVQNLNKNLTVCSYHPSDHALSGDASAMFLLRIAREKQTWKICPIEDTHAVARDFGSLIPHLKSYTKDILPSIDVDPTERVAIMRKGGNVRLRDYSPGGQQVPQVVRLGLAWDVTNGVNIDLDASVICLDANLNLVDMIWFKHLQTLNNAIRHHGDEREGDALGDDEKIDLVLDRVSSKIQYLGFCINSYSGQELDDVKRACCHLFDPSAAKNTLDLCSYVLANASHVDGHTALVLGCLYRDTASNDWCLSIISEAAQGRTADCNVDELQKFLRRNPPKAPTPLEDDEEEIVIEPEMPKYAPFVEEEIDLSAPIR